MTTLSITRSNVTFVGTGKDTTTILGGFSIDNLENITFKNMTVTNTSDNGRGIYMSNATVELMDVALKGCSASALIIPTSSSLTTVVATHCEFANSHIGAFVYGNLWRGPSNLTSATFKNCVFNDNTYCGIYGEDTAKIHLHGEATKIHSNHWLGICADSAKVVIHLPSHHNTSYNNKDDDRYTIKGGTITNVED